MKPILYVALLLMVAFSCKNKSDLNINSEDKEILNTPKTVIDNAHNSKTSLDYLGTYKGIIPCASCEGIQTVLTLLKDETFSRTVQYLGKETQGTTQNGTYSWDDEGSKIVVITTTGETQMYQVKENILVHLDGDGNRIESDFAEQYQLLKQSN